jgi:hypothetical protein
MMAAAQVDFGQPSSSPSPTATYSPVDWALAIPFVEPCPLENSERIIGELSHAPPVSNSFAVLPLRI